MLVLSSAHPLAFCSAENPGAKPDFGIATFLLPPLSHIPLATAELAWRS